MIDDTAATVRRMRQPFDAALLRAIQPGFDPMSSPEDGDAQLVLSEYLANRVPVATMTDGEFDDLARGDLVRHAFGSETMVVHDNYGERVTAARTVDITNRSEWTLVSKANHGRTAGRL